MVHLGEHTRSYMSLSIQTNVLSLGARGHLQRSQRALAKNFARISSGERINSASDDAAGLAVAENLSAQHGSSRVAARNINDGLGMIATAEGALDEIADILKRQRELAIQYSSDTLGDTERGYAQDEFDALKEEVNRISETVEFNGIKLSHSGSPWTGSELDVQVGIHDSADDRIAIKVRKMDHDSLRFAATQFHSVSFNNPKLNSVSNARAAIDGLGYMLDVVNKYRGENGAVQNRLTAALNNLETHGENLAASESRIRDADFAFETAQMSKHQIMQQAGTAVLGQANALPQSALRLI